MLQENSDLGVPPAGKGAVCPQGRTFPTSQASRGAGLPLAPRTASRCSRLRSRRVEPCGRGTRWSTATAAGSGPGGSGCGQTHGLSAPKRPGEQRRQPRPGLPSLPPARPALPHLGGFSSAVTLFIVPDSDPTGFHLGWLGRRPCLLPQGACPRLSTALVTLSLSPSPQPST